MSNIGYIEDLRGVVGNMPLILVGAVTLVVKENKILLQQRIKPKKGVWGLPGGLMELGESTEETARREIFEEAGLMVGELELIDVFSGKRDFLKLPNGDEFYSVTIAYSTEEVYGEIKVDERESLEFKYFNIYELPEELVLSHRRMINRYIEINKNRL